ncbi:MAG TPA: hypothetical protein VFJ58_21885 [Armatimonadota bacterium]|nr:hypothetical protein [Armatimonadota bacterium]
MDSTYGDINIKDVPLYIAVEKLASLFKRQLVLSGRVLVLRDQDRVIKDRFNYPEFPWKLGPQGRGYLKAVSGPDGAPAVRGAAAVLLSSSAAAAPRAQSILQGDLFVGSGALVEAVQNRHHVE